MRMHMHIYTHACTCTYTCRLRRGLEETLARKIEQPSLVFTREAGAALIDGVKQLLASDAGRAAAAAVAPQPTAIEMVAYASQVSR